jgi:hypothetical protein
MSKTDERFVQVMDLISAEPGIPDAKKLQLLTELQKMTPLQTDTWVYRLVVCFLGFTVLCTVIGGFMLRIKFATATPEGLIALGSAAVGALAGLLAPSPSSK